eukprot:10210796-Karenia_brevis.AAC.1
MASCSRRACLEDLAMRIWASNGRWLVITRCWTEARLHWGLRGQWLAGSRVVTKDQMWCRNSPKS